MTTTEPDPAPSLAPARSVAQSSTEPVLTPAVPARSSEDLRLAVRAATMYHLEGATQAEIAVKLGVSRPTAGRLIARARAQGLVTIEINVPPELQGTVNTDVERALEDRFGLTEALVVSDEIDGTDSGYGSLGVAAASLLTRRLLAEDTLGFTWGPETVAVARSLRAKATRCAQVVQLDGSMSSADYQTGVEFTLGTCAEKLQARPVRLNAPLYADPATVTALQNDSIMSRALKTGTEADVMMYGLGPVSTSTTLFEGSFLDTQVLGELQDLGAVGEIGGRFFTVDGNETGGSLPARTVSVDLGAVRACARAVLISGGARKQEAILGALRGGLASMLVTDIGQRTLAFGADPLGSNEERYPVRISFDKRARRGLGIAALGMTASLALSACAGAGSFGGNDGDKVITVAIVSNSQMQDAIKLSPEFEKDHPGTKLKFVSLSENEARAKITASVATGGGEFDVVMISNFETPQWAQNGWLTNLSDYADKTPGYDEKDFVPTLQESLSYKGSMYAVPFYGESSFLMYRKDLMAAAGITMPEKPTWDQVAAAAAKLDNPAGGMSGICLRGKPGWGEVLAPLDTVINAFGGRWYDENWNAQLTSPAVEKAVQFYVDTVRAHGEAGAATSGFGECATQLSQGNTAMWYDATSAVSVLEDPTSSKVVGKIGYAQAPTAAKDNNGWLYSWALGIPKTSKSPQDAWDFVSWMTNKEYIQKVGSQLGWERVPPGSRLSTYDIPQYKEAAAAYGPLTLESMENANPNKPTVDPVPYTGVQFLTIPEFQDLGTRVSQQISAAIAGQISVQDALSQAQNYAEVVGKTYQEEQR